MKKVEEGIVFSNDIYSILRGVNALNFDYRGRGMMLPIEEEIQKIRQDFLKDVKRIFNGNVTILVKLKWKIFYIGLYVMF